LDSLSNSEVNNVLIGILFQKVKNLKNKMECRSTLISEKSEGGIGCHGGVTILCRLVTPAVCPQSKLGIGVTRCQGKYGNDGQTKDMKHYSACWSVIICNHKQGHYSDRKFAN
jgi:hypothetical protein